MCGRTAQTVHAVQVAAAVMGAAPPRQNSNGGNNGNNNNNNNNGNNAADDGGNDTTYEWGDNYNLSPGMDAMIMRLDSDTGKIETVKHTWGLITRGGTSSKPIAEGMGKHFESLMFNARSDTLWDKGTFTGLLHKARSCLIAVDGFYEWKTELGNQKQPYFVYRHKSEANAAKPYLLFAGLWTSVQTGRSESPTLDTFTVLTTEVCDDLKWLHTRMPVCVWDDDLGKQWLRTPSRNVHKQLVKGAQASTQSMQIQWHAVSTQMSSLKYRDIKAMARIAMTKSVKSFFSVKKTTASDATTKASSSVVKKLKSHSSSKESLATIHFQKKQQPYSMVEDHEDGQNLPTKRSRQPQSPPRVPQKKPKAGKKGPTKTSSKGSITSFFKPKEIS